MDEKKWMIKAKTASVPIMIQYFVFFMSSKNKEKAYAHGFKGKFSIIIMKIKPKNATFAVL